MLCELWIVPLYTHHTPSWIASLYVCLYNNYKHAQRDPAVHVVVTCTPVPLHVHLYLCRPQMYRWPLELKRAEVQVLKPYYNLCFFSWPPVPSVRQLSSVLIIMYSTEPSLILWYILKHCLLPWSEYLVSMYWIALSKECAYVGMWSETGVMYINKWILWFYKSKHIQLPGVLHGVERCHIRKRVSSGCYVWHWLSDCRQHNNIIV